MKKILIETDEGYCPMCHCAYSDIHQCEAPRKIGFYTKENTTSVNHYIKVNTKTFTIWNCDTDTHRCVRMGKGKTLEEVIKIVQKYMKRNVTEYGVHFI